MCFAGAFSTHHTLSTRWRSALVGIMDFTPALCVPTIICRQRTTAMMRRVITGAACDMHTIRAGRLQAAARHRPHGVQAPTVPVRRIDTGSTFPSHGHCSKSVKETSRRPFAYAWWSRRKPLLPLASRHAHHRRHEPWRQATLRYALEYDDYLYPTIDMPNRPVICHQKYPSHRIFSTTRIGTAMSASFVRPTTAREVPKSRHHRFGRETFNRPATAVP